jgi:hypothetical protein
MIRAIPYIVMGLLVSISVAQAPAKIAHTVNTHTPGVVQW